MSAQLLAAVVVAASVAAWGIFMAYLRARPEAAPPVESSLMSAQSSTGALPGTLVERTPRARSSGNDAAGVTRRQFLNRAYFAAVGVASPTSLWPRSTTCGREAAAG